MAGRLEEYERLLRQLSLRADASDHAIIQRILDRVSPESVRNNGEVTENSTGAHIGRR